MIISGAVIGVYVRARNENINFEFGCFFSPWGCMLIQSLGLSSRVAFSCRIHVVYIGSTVSPGGGCSNHVLFSWRIGSALGKRTTDRIVVEGILLLEDIFKWWVFDRYGCFPLPPSICILFFR
jgi:hypothetical protein